MILLKDKFAIRGDIEFGRYIINYFSQNYSDVARMKEIDGKNPNLYYHLVFSEKSAKKSLVQSENIPEGYREVKFRDILGISAFENKQINSFKLDDIFYKIKYKTGKVYQYSCDDATFVIVYHADDLNLEGDISSINLFAKNDLLLAIKEYQSTSIIIGGRGSWYLHKQKLHSKCTIEKSVRGQTILRIRDEGNGRYCLLQLANDKFDDDAKSKSNMASNCSKIYIQYIPDRFEGYLNSSGKFKDVTEMIKVSIREHYNSIEKLL